MKRRFLITIGLVLAAAIASVGVLQYLLFRSEQYRLIDSRIESTATLLISSDLSKADLKDFDEAENIISEVVGGERFNQFIVIYKRTGEEIYRSANAEVLPESIPKDEKWRTIETEEGHIIRVLTLPLGRPRSGKGAVGGADMRILQTGLILDEDLLRMKTLSRNVIMYSLMIMALILLTTLWLSEALLSPLKELAIYLRHMGSRLELSPDMRAPEPVAPITSSDDEFGLLVAETRRLRDLIGHGLKNTQAWTAQMAHEMKTPLTVLQNSLERARAEIDSEKREANLKEAGDEVAHLNSLINSFLEWQAAENFPEVSEELHVVRLGNVTREMIARFERQNPGRLRLEGDSQRRVFGKRGFVHQAISNLITNALKYSPSDSKVNITLHEDRVEIVDEGGGLPAHVIDHLGEPFNYGAKDRHGFGLGLAWVSTICRKYGWTLGFERRNVEGRERTVARIAFPDEG